jgi:hypothetical protein
MNPLTHIACGGATAVGIATGEAVISLDRRPDGNITLTREQLLTPLMAPPLPGLLDLLDIAAYAYVGDQAVRRDRRPTRGADTGWRRALHFYIPVREPELWTTAADDLSDILGFLSDDDYRFTFTRLADPPDRQPLLPFTQTPFDGVVDDVALFSGGLDSVAGAARLIAAGRRPLLVTHRSTNKLAGRQGRLLAGLDALAGDRWPIHLPVTVNKDAPLTAEDTQRSRSFLFAALGGLVAATVGLDRLLFFENGVVSLNLPPSGAVIGGRATRTTHPRVLAGFARLLTVAAGRPFAVENRFRDHTKTDVVGELIAAGGRDLIRASTSCVHTRELTDEFPHCGRCSQCIDRRFAVLAAGAGGDDPAEAYRVDLITGVREPEDAGLLAGYAEQATELGQMADPLAFFARYGEAVRAVRDGPESQAEAAARVYRLHRRHADQVNGVIEQALRDHAAEIRTGTLPPTCLVRLASDRGQVIYEPAESADPLPPNVLRRRGEVWEARFDSGEPFLLLPARGLTYLHALLTQAGMQVSVSVLGTRAGLPNETADASSDRETLNSYRLRLEELAEERDWAERNNDKATAARVEDERQRILAQLSADSGMRGRVRNVRALRDKVRGAVGNAIRRAIKGLGRYCPEMEAHLQPPRLRLGSNPVYCPTEGIAWQTD